MKKAIWVILFFFSASLSIAQKKDNVDIRMKTEYSTENKELSDLMRFENIDFYQVQFIGDKINSKDYQLICKEIWDGNVKSIDTLLNTKDFQGFPKTETDTLSVKVYAKKTDEPKLKLWFRFPQFGINRKFDAIQSDDYSLRDVGISENIIYGRNFYAFAYILPYEKDGMKFWCAVDSSGKDVESWGREFGIKHYLVFEMLFE
ncbi:hypothetical protein [Flagellimonas baculiformis]|uniref:hypothetical protein n=1 Tax=Flagellimonas baculiformis TaxID=3067310 RepID=UPI00296E6C9D|nr:hypothetical protein [Muricauda sp. D6]